MTRTDIKIEDRKITIHPKKLESLKKEARARIGSDGRAILADGVIDEELEKCVELRVIEEIEDEIRAEIRPMLVEAVK